ncbi:MAG: translocation/assembly module TamB domain-containing protein [Chitinophagales bacterium]
MKKRILKILFWILAVLLLLSGIFLLLVRLPSVQTYLAQKATDALSSKLGTKVSVERVEISFFHQAEFVNFYMEDLQHDTMIYANELQVSFDVFDLINKEVNVHGVTLDGATVYMHRDTSGKHMNMSEVFSRLSKKDTTTPVKPSKFGWKVELQYVSLENTSFRYFDEKGHLDLKVYVPDCEIDLEKFDLQKKLIAIASAEIKGADVSIDVLKHEKVPNTDTNHIIHFLPADMQITYKDVSMAESRFRFTDHGTDTILPKGMDFKHLDITGINLQVDKGAVIADTIFANIQNLSAKDRSGFTLTQLKTDARVSVNDITLNKLYLKTPESEIKNFLSFKYQYFFNFKDFTNGVRIDANLNGSKLSLKDLNYFVRKLDAVEHNRFAINGELHGPISNLRGKGIEISTGTVTAFKGDFTARGLPKIFETSLNLRVTRLSTSMDDLRHIYPSLKIPENLNSLGTMNYQGNFDGFITDFVSTGKLVTSVGYATTDLNFKYDKEKNKSAYSGALALIDFDLGKFFRDERTLGKVSMATKIKGGGLTLESLKADLDGNISSIVLKDYNYKDLKIDGTVKGKSFTGSLRIDDPHLKMDFVGAIDATHKVPEFRFSSKVYKAELEPLHLSQKNIVISGQLSSDFSGDKIDNFVGSVSLNDVNVIRDDSIEASIDNMRIEARLLSAETKKIRLISDFAEGEIEGDFTIRDLPKALLSFAKATFTKGYVDTVNYGNQNFTVNLRINNPLNITRVLVPQLYSVRDAQIKADFSSSAKHLNATGQIGEVRFGNFRFKDINLFTNAVNGSLDVRTYIDKVYSGDSLMLDTARVLAETTPNRDFRFDVLLADKYKKNYVDLTAFLTPLKDLAVIKLEPSDVKLANYHWHFDPNNIIYVSGKKITTQNLVFRSAEQTVYISSYLKDDTSTSFKLTLDNTSISDFTGIFTTKIRDMRGNVNGKLEVQDVFYKPKIFADFVIDQFSVGQELIGDVNIETRLDSNNNRVLVNMTVKSANYFADYRNDVEAKGYVQLGKNPYIDIDINAPKLGLNFLNYKFFERYVKDVKGYAIIRNGKISGPTNKPILTGDVELVNDTVTVSFLNTTYNLHHQHVKLDEFGFNFGDRLEAYDSRGKLLVASGRIRHQSFKRFELDCGVTTENAMFLNTTEKQSPYFYGVAYGKGLVRFSGMINSPVITAYATTLPGTYCKMPITSTYETNRQTFYKFVTPGKDTARAIIPLKLNGVRFDLTLKVTPDARFDIILDPISGDVLTCYGSSDPMQITLPKVGNMTIRGTYILARGQYLFTLQNIINKRFDITPGSTVNFTGDAYKAALNVSASYQVTSTVSDLIQEYIDASGSGSLPAAARSRVKVKLLMNLTGILEKPNIAFEVQVPDVDPTLRSYVDQKLAWLKTNDAEMNKQAFGLLVMNRFLPLSSTTGSVLSQSNAYGGTAANTVSEFLSSQLSNYLSGLLELGGVKNLDVNINYRQYDQLSGLGGVTGPTGSQSSAEVRRELQLALQQRLLNDRLTISAGGNLDFGNSQTVNSSGQETKAVIPTGDFQIEYALTPDGRWKAKAFNRTNYDYYNSRNYNRTGIGLSYSKEFDKPSELFQKRKQKKKEKQLEKNTPPANTNEKQPAVTPDDKQTAPK